MIECPALTRPRGLRPRKRFSPSACNVSTVTARSAIRRQRSVAILPVVELLRPLSFIREEQTFYGCFSFLYLTTLKEPQSQIYNTKSHAMS